MQQEDFSGQAGPGPYPYWPLTEPLILSFIDSDITSLEEESASPACKNSYPEMSAGRGRTGASLNQHSLVATRLSSRRDATPKAQRVSSSGSQ
jgi:hypothetical protein